MGKYVPTAITYAKSGLVKDKDAFVLSDDAYQNLENIYQWRGRLRRRQGYSLLGRLRRDLLAQSQANADGTNDYNIADILTSFRANEPDASLAKSSVILTFDPGGGNETKFTDNGTALFTRTSGTAYNFVSAQTITDISQAASAVIDIAGHTFVVGNKLYIQSVVGMTEINDTVVTITGINAGVDVTVGLDTTSFTRYESGGTANGTFVNYESGEVNFTFVTGSTPAGGITVQADYGYYPSLPVMGLPNRELDAINAEQTVAFDTIYAYNYNNTSNQFQELPAVTATTWTGANSDFFWGTNYWQTADNAQYYWVTNFSGAGGDPIRAYDGTDWYDFTPALDGSGSPELLTQCRMIIPYKGRFVALNTFEGTAVGNKLQYPQRARWSQNGAPLSSVNAGTAPTALNEWRSDVKGRGGFVDCPINEHIVSAEFIRDTLVVGFERSTWLLRYTGNEILPFVWERINKELGCESTFSMVAFDQGILEVGDKSINTCNGNSVERIDDNIPDEVFNIHNNNGDGPLRVHGKRDFFERLVYWTYPDSGTNVTYPDKVLVFNYHNQTWATFKDSFTCFGQYQRFNDITWADLVDTSWDQANFSWVTSKLQSQFPNIVAGNQQGYVLTLNQKVSNDQSLQITNVVGGSGAARITVPDHNLQSPVFDPESPTEYVEINDIIGTGGLELNGRIFQVNREDADTLDLYEKPRTAITAITQATQAVVTSAGHSFTVGQHFYIDNVLTGMTEISGLNGIIVAVSGNSLTIDIDTTDFTASTVSGYIQNLDATVVPAVVQARTYMGCGNITRVMGFSARSKKFNLIDQGKKTFLGQIDFLTEKTDGGEVSCEIFTDYNDSEAINQGDDGFFNTVFSTQPEQFDQPGQSKYWHRFFTTTDAQFFEYDLNLNERQMFTKNIVNSEVLIDSIIIWSEMGSRLTS